MMKYCTDKKQVIDRTLIRDDRKIIAFYLFGSYAAGRPMPSSDVDLAVLLDESVNKEDYLMERLNLMGKVSTILGIDVVEVL